MKQVLLATVAVAFLGLGGCGTPRPFPISEFAGEERLTSADVVDIALASADTERVDPWFHAFGDKSRGGVLTGPIWKRVFRGDERSIAKLVITKAELRESISGMGFTMRCTYIVEAHLIIEHRDYPIRGEGSRAAAIELFSAMRQAVELGVADTARQASAILMFKRIEPNQPPSVAFGKE